MHDALLISEILSCIIDHLAEDTVRHPNAVYAKGTRKARQRALAFLARTCRAFSEPALDALWRRLHSLGPFVLCLPAKASYDDGTLVWQFLLRTCAVCNAQQPSDQPAFDEEEWKIVSRYTPRVQELTLDHDQLSVEILQSLWFRTTLLLPNLRNLYWIYDDCTIIASIRLLLSPSLVHLHVWLDGGNHSSVLGLLECYHTQSPNLKSLYFGHLCRFPYITTAVSRAISRSQNLETLTCDPIDETVLIHIAKSRCLKGLSASLLNHQPDNLRRLADYATLDHPPFANLLDLELRVEDLSSIIPYLKSHQQPFESVAFHFRILPTPKVLHEFFTALSSTTRRGTLRRITLLSLGLRIGGPPSQAVDSRVLSLLTTFRLHTFDVNLNNSVSLDDDELARLVQAWPDLETFHFNQRTGLDHHETFRIPTLRGLLLLIARCPKLRSLGVCVDARNIPSLSEDESLICNTAITRLFLANSPIQEPVERVAQFLLEHFPSLVTLAAWIPFNGRPLHDYRRMWREVSMLIQEISGYGLSSESSDSETVFL